MAWSLGPSDAHPKPKNIPCTSTRLPTSSFGQQVSSESFWRRCQVATVVTCRVGYWVDVFVQLGKSSKHHIGPVSGQDRVRNNRHSSRCSFDQESLEHCWGKPLEYLSFRTPSPPRPYLPFPSRMKPPRLHGSQSLFIWIEVCSKNR